MKKKLIALLLALSMLLTLMAGCKSNTSDDGNTSDPSAESSQPEQTNQPEKTGYDDEELDRAVAYGFGEYREDDPAVTYQEFMAMLDRAVALTAPDKSAEWMERFPEARQSTDPIDKGNAALAVFSAAETLGGEVYARNLLDQGEGRYDEITPSSYWGDARRVPVGYEGIDKTEDANFDVEAPHYVTYRGSLISGRTIFELDAAGVFHSDEPLSYTDALRAALRFYESTLDLSERYPNEEDAALLAEVEAKKQAILNSETSVTYTGTAYYVSNGGDDKNSGTSPEQAWATTNRVNAAKYDGTLKRGDAVFFERGGLFRGWIDCAVGVTYSAYGTGEKPKIYGSSEDGSGAEKWTLWYDQNGVKIWKYYRDMTEVGNIVFDDGDSYATRIYSYYNGESWVLSGADQRPFDVSENLRDDLTFYSTYDLSRAEFERYAADMGGTVWADMIHKAGPLYLRCDAGNPGEIYQEIEFHQMPEDMNGYIGLVTTAGDNVIDNLSIKYCVVNGIAIYGSDNENSDNNNNVIQNCEIAWTGGTQHDLNQSGGIVEVCGENIVCKTDYNVFRNNYMYQSAACGIVFEFVGNEWLPGTCATGNRIEGNVIERIMVPFLFWDNVSGNLDGDLKDHIFFQDITVRDNYAMYTYYGWSGDLRFTSPSNTNYAFGETFAFAFGFGGEHVRAKDITVSNNVFYLSNGESLIHMGDISGTTFSGNTYVQGDNRKIIARNLLTQRLTVEEIKAGIAEILGDTTAKVFAPSVPPVSAP